MDGESILVYAQLANLAGIAAIALLVWTSRKGREEGVRASDIAAIRKDIHELHDLINVRPTVEMVKLKMDLLETHLRLEIKTTEAALAAVTAAAAAAAAHRDP